MDGALGADARSRQDPGPILYFLVARRGRAAELQREGALTRGRLLTAAAGPALGGRLVTYSPTPDSSATSWRTAG